MSSKFSDVLSNILEEQLQEVSDIITSQETQDQLLKVVQDNFIQGNNPYGTSWNDDRKKKDNQLLYKTGNLYNSYNTYNTPDSIVLTNNAPYAGAMNDRWQLIPGGDLPEEFMSWLNEEIERKLR